MTTLRDHLEFRRHPIAQTAALILAGLLALSTALIGWTPASAAGASGVINGSFDDGDTSWWATENLKESVDTSSGAMCVEVPGATVNPWDAIVGQDGFTLPADDYVLSLDISAATPDGQPVGVRALMQDPATYATVLDKTVQAGAEPSHFNLGFSVDQDFEDRQMAFQFGGATQPWTFCLDNVVLEAGKVLPPYAPETGPRVRVNQVGYLPDGPKRATLVTDQTASAEWKLSDGTATVASGQTTPAPADPSSLLTAHTIDFSDVTAPGTYTLSAEGDTSYEFTIGTDAYEQLRTDSLAYFYLARSRTEIDPALVGADYARAAGHVSTAGGWYDAGDQGKYVVNGAIATAQLRSTYERTLTATTADDGALGDGTLAIPESNNGVPDVLDEAKWEFDFMTSMMVPQGENLAGMVHHKIHDFGRTGLPLMPADDPQTRYLHRPSTAAILNLAATAAQGARLFEPYDADYSAQLLDSARTAWAAAVTHPDLYAPATDGDNGGGAYPDQEVSDEFYWAAAELYLTTGEQEFENYVVASPLNTRNVFPTGGFSWGSVAALARMDLATVPSELSEHDAVVASVLAGTDGMLAEQAHQPFGQVLPANQYVWGSNSQVLNNIVVLGTAYDLSGDVKYRDGALESTDYLLGRNALNLSYVTGYGTEYAQNQHSRWFANQLNPELPHPPNGSVAGGPNASTGTWDPVASGLFSTGCAPQFCYVDDIGSFSTNEITINWNSALAWVASFAADQGATPSTATDAGGAPGAAAAAAETGTSPWAWVLALVGAALILSGIAILVFRRRGALHRPSAVRPAREAEPEPPA